jgi:hypothetical protein
MNDKLEQVKNYGIMLGYIETLMTTMADLRDLVKKLQTEVKTKADAEYTELKNEEVIESPVDYD